MLDDLMGSYDYLRGGPPLRSTMASPSVGGLQGLLDLVMSSTKQQHRQRPNTPGGLNELLWRVPGHESHLHVAKTRGIVPLGRRLERMGFDVGEHPKFGGVAPVHTDNSYHYSNDALDVNYRGGGRWNTEPQALDWLAKWLGRRF